jgi:DNA invertase Pin-like site-specific DNA recombinase
MGKIIGVYIRISSGDKQSTESQQLAISEYIDHNNLPRDKIRVYMDSCSGTLSTRPQLDLLMESVRKGLVGEIIFWRLDRLGRSVSNLIDLMTEFKEFGVRVKSLRDNLDTSTASGQLAFNMLAAVAQFEHDLISERTIAGLLNARRNDIPLGRPPHSKDKRRRKTDGYKSRWAQERLKKSTELMTK